MYRQPFLLPALLLLTALRLALLPLRELSPIEAYAVVCGDHGGLWHAMLGPVLPALIHITTSIFGPSEFGVRVLAPLIMLGASWLLWLIARGLFDTQTATWGVVFFNVLPAVNLAAVTFTPMTLGIALSIVLLFAIRRALHHSHRWHLEWWVVSGVLCLAFFTDWRMILFAAAGAFALGVTGRGRRALLKWPVLPIAGGALGIAVTVFLAWISEHRWNALHTFPDYPPLSIGSMSWRFLLAHPLPALGGLIWALVRCVTRKPLTYPVAYLFAFGLPMMSLDALAFGAQPWPHCGYCGWIAPAVLLLAHQLRQWQPASFTIKPLARFTVLSLSGLQACIILQTDITRRNGVIWKLSPTEEAPVSWLPADPSSDLMGWRDFASALKRIMHDEQEKLKAPPMLATDHWQLAAPLAVYLKDAPQLQPSPAFPEVIVLPRFDRVTPYTYRPGLSEAVKNKAPVLFFTDRISVQSPPAQITKHYASVRLVGFFNIKHQNLVIRSVKVFACSQ